MKNLLMSLTAILALIFAVPISGARAEILGPGWQYHRPLYVHFSGLQPPGLPIAWASFDTNSSRLPDGSDLRITTMDGQVLSMRLMRVSAHDDMVRVAFAAPADGEYFAWWGNPQPGAAPPPLDINSGVWMQVFHYSGGRHYTWRQMQALFEDAESLESYFIPNIFIGYDPRGWETHAMFLYHAMLHIPSAGGYLFAFDTGGIGYVKLDGRPLLVKTNGSWMWGHVRFRRWINLKPGWHRITAANINLWGPAGIALDWRPPGQRQFSPVPAADFAQAAEARVGRIRQNGSGYAADFDVRPQAQIFTPPSHYLQRYAFDARVPASFDPQVQWSFSDGQTAAGLRCQHIFLTPGVYTVTVTIQQAGNTFTASRHIRVRSELIAQFPYPPSDPPIIVANMINTYQLSRLSGQELYRGVQFFRHFNSYRGLNRWAKAWAASPDPQPQAQVLATAESLVRSTLADKHYRQAANLDLLMAHKRIPPSAQAELLAHYAITASNYTSSAAWATQTLTDWLHEHPDAGANVRHILNTALAYAAVAQGNGPVAEALVKKAEAETTHPPVSYGAGQIRQGVFARDVESYIHSGDFATAQKLLYQWEMEFPSAILDGYTRLLRVDLLQREGRPLIAAAIAEQYVKAEPRSFYAAKLLDRAYQALLAGDERSQALLIHAKLKQDYPESPYAHEANSAR